MAQDDPRIFQTFQLISQIAEQHAAQLRLIAEARILLAMAPQICSWGEGSENRPLILATTEASVTWRGDGIVARSKYRTTFRFGSLIFPSLKNAVPVRNVLEL
jgi:hypothetical protein